MQLPDRQISVTIPIPVCLFVLTPSRHWTGEQTDRICKTNRALHALHADARKKLRNADSFDVMKCSMLSLNSDKYVNVHLWQLYAVQK